MAIQSVLTLQNIRIIYVRLFRTENNSFTHKQFSIIADLGIGTTIQIIEDFSSIVYIQLIILRFLIYLQRDMKLTNQESIIR